ncbi:uncharacterized protein LOC141586042 isoform X2 [Silene latifolia]|uniref:uncharacterized protein LOC141586042 isoform X2 n=1 Tax=Silene latifolia TaxID=37657 RepID=UPI003D7801E0
MSREHSLCLNLKAIFFILTTAHVFVSKLFLSYRLLYGQQQVSQEYHDGEFSSVSGNRRKLYHMDAVLAMSICILLVDNNRASSVRESLLLRLSKYQVVTADTGKEALHMLQTTQISFNLVLAAMNLPDIDSFEFMRKVDEETRLPIVMMSDYYDPAIIMKALMGGAKLCILKPLTISDIRKLWQIQQRKVIGQKRKADELQRRNCWCIGQPSSSAWRPDVKHKLLTVDEGLPRFYSAPQVVARRNYALGTSNALPVEKQQCNLESARPCNDALADTASSSPPMAGQPIDQQANECMRYKEGSLLRRYLENHHSRKQLKRLIVVSLNKWDAVPNALSVTPPLPPSPPSDVPPISVPLALAAYIEHFLHSTMAVGRAPPGFEREVASRVASTGPSVLSEFLECDEELEPGFLEELDTEELFDAIEELRD